MALCMTCGSSKRVIPSTRPRTICNDGVSLSIQANEMTYCTPRNNEGPYTHVEVGFIEFANGDIVIPPDTWKEYADSYDFPSNVYAYIPIELVEEFIAFHGGRKFFV